VLLLATPSNLGQTDQVVSLGDGQRFVIGHDMLTGRIETLDINGNWVTQQAGVRFDILTPEQLAELNRPIGTPIPPPPPPPILPGRPIDQPQQPTIEVYPAPTEPAGPVVEIYPMPELLTWEDLIFNATGAQPGTNANQVPSFLDPQATTHILDGDATGGGHRPGTGIPGKSEFPPTWPDQRITDSVTDVANDPNSSRTPSFGGRSVIRGNRDGIDITVIVQGNGRIITAFPANVPRNP
jgi:Bacterial EndoU nuclease